MKAYLSLTLSVVFILCFSNRTEAQFWETYKQSYGYFGNSLINPGFVYGLERPIWDSETSKSFGLPFGRSTINGSGNAAIYWDPFSHTGFLNYYECNFRQYFGRQTGIQLGAAPGFQMNFTTDNYVVDEDFHVRSRGLNIDSYFAFQLSAALFYSDRGNEKHWISKVSLLFLSPYNTGILPVLNYEYRYQF